MSSAERFRYEWVTFQKIIPAYQKQFEKWIKPVKLTDFNNKVVLDAGCGIGRNSYWPLLFGAKKVIAFDVNPDTTKVAKKNLFGFRNAEVKTESIYKTNYKNMFDYSLCIGVLHHLADPALAIRNLIRATKNGGKIIVWVYGYEGNEWIVRFVNPIRFVTSRIPPSLTNIIAYFFSLLLLIYVKILPQKKPYFRQLKTFMYWHIHSIVLDQLLPKIANYWKKKEVERLFSNKNLKSVKISDVNNMSWAIVATKC